MSVTTPCINLTCQTMIDGSIKVAYKANLKLSSQLQLAYSPGDYSYQVKYYTVGGILLETATNTFTLVPMQYSFTSTFNGFMGQQGELIVNLTVRPSTALALQYSVSSILDPSACKICNSSYLDMVGTVKYFSSQTIDIQGLSGGVVYAQGTITVYYPCPSGCQICNGTTCTQCFSSTYTPLIYFYNGVCLGACPSATYTADSSCIDCQANCFKCTSTQCQQCKSGYYLYKFACVQTCPDGYIVVGSSCEVKPLVCQTGCKTCLT